MLPHTLTVDRSATRCMLIACLCIFVSTGVCWAEPQDKPADESKAVQLTVVLNDGSLYLGYVNAGSLRLISPSTGGSVELPWAKIKSIAQTKPNTSTATRIRRSSKR